ncbi:hypothetical protein BB561_003609 [Smittium simulii]|uniref:Methyltransferase small domain-containing protein n=1 Tax=Smittium simulii TaxID=133385 RepID=A0A2T9YKJ0_9FUNG|nr:hypothetical protein BB561_003609 [Smittium simulii]
MALKLKQIESYLQEVESFGKRFLMDYILPSILIFQENKNPKLEFEQYPTTAHLAAQMLYTAQNSFDDIEGKAVADLGCGCGMLSIASAIVGASHITGLEIDNDAIEIFQSNVEEFDGMPPIDIINLNLMLKSIDICDQNSNSNHAKILESNMALLDKMEKRFDTVVMNPPFGTKPGNKGIDFVFLKIASFISNGAIYSLHKTSTRDYITKSAKKLGYTAQVIAKLKFDIPKMYSFHKKASVDVYVDFIRFAPI